MSQYTTQLRFICESLTGHKLSNGYNSINDIIQNAIPIIFDFDFPFFDENFKNVLCTDFLRHYYTREICCETYGLWKLRLADRFNMIMPYYNQLYSSTLIDYDIFNNVNLKTTSKNNNTTSTTSKNNSTFNSTNDSTSKTTNNSTNNKTGTVENTNVNNNTVTDTTTQTNSSTGTANSDDIDKFSETPQTSLASIQNDTYLTNARIKNNNSSATNSSTIKNTGDVTTHANSETTDEYNVQDKTTGIIDNTAKNTTENSSEITSKSDNTSVDDYIQNVVGKNNSISNTALLNEYRQSLLNINKMIIDELADLFIQIW